MLASSPWGVEPSSCLHTFSGLSQQRKALAPVSDSSSCKEELPDDSNGSPDITQGGAPLHVAVDGSQRLGSTLHFHTHQLDDLEGVTEQL